MRYLLVLTMMFAMISACKKENLSQAEIDDEIIRQYLADNDLDAEKHESGLYYLEVVEGSGGHPNVNSTIEVRYKGYLTNGYVFDETQGSATMTLPLNQMIVGWQIGIPLMKSGGTGILFIPSAYGYGSQPGQDIPPNSVLIFEVDLL